MSHQELSPSAPSSPRIKRIEKRMMTLGCAPAMIGGMLAFAAPSAATLGLAVTLVVALPILLHGLRLRRDNQRRWDEARRRARNEGLVVKTIELDSGDHDYRLLTQDEHDRERWGDDLSQWQAARADEPDEADEDDRRA